VDCTGGGDSQSYGGGGGAESVAAGDDDDEVKLGSARLPEPPHETDRVVGGDGGDGGTTDAGVCELEGGGAEGEAAPEAVEEVGSAEGEAAINMAEGEAAGLARARRRAHSQHELRSRLASCLLAAAGGAAASATAASPPSVGFGAVHRCLQRGGVYAHEPAAAGVGGAALTKADVSALWFAALRSCAESTVTSKVSADRRRRESSESSGSATQQVRPFRRQFRLIFTYVLSVLVTEYRGVRFGGRFGCDSPVERLFFLVTQC
jgi:hypothetical protein